MRLRRLEIRDFRKIGHLVVEGLADGLNVLVGDNEAGKSTVLAALRAVLFERHRVGGKVVAAMLPHGQEVRPEITIDFEVGGGAYRLRKAFNQRPEAELHGPGGARVSGDAVEERLATLLGFLAPGNRGSRPDEHQGVYGLLWVDQGLAHTPLNSGGGQATLAGALESEVGQVLGGERGRHLLAAAERRRDTFWDKRDTPKPRGDFRLAQESLAKLEVERDAIDRRLRAHDEKVATLAGKVEALQRHTRDDRPALAARAVEQARAAMDKTVRLAATLDEVARARNRAALDRDAASEKVTTRIGIVGRLKGGEGKLGVARSEHEVGVATLHLANQEATRRATHLLAARTAREASDRALVDLDRAFSRLQARQDVSRAGRRLAEAEQVATGHREALAAAEAIRVGKKDLAEVDRLCAERDAALVRRDAASVRIDVAPFDGARLLVDGVPVDPATPLALARDAVLDLSGFGRLTVQPGGGVVDLARAVEAAERKLADRLRPLGQPSRNDLANALARKAERETEAAGHARVFAVLVPQGLDALRAELRGLEAAAGPDDIGEAPSEAARDMLRGQRATEFAAERAAADAATAADQAREQAARQEAVLAERAAAALRERDAAASGLDAARTIAADERLEAHVAEADEALARTTEAEAAARLALEAADPDTAALVLRRAEQAQAALRHDIESLTREKLVLETELRTLGQEGLGELLEDTEGQLTLLHRQIATATLDAQASLLLHTTLAAAQRESKDRWLGPVRERVRPYLRLIQPDSEIVLNEKTFSIEHLVRGGVSEPFDSLSVGAREQVAVITRLALADILRASGQPSAIILDDALVNTDEKRLERMHLVLHKAAETLQVLVLTCRERDFIGLGAPIHRL